MASENNENEVEKMPSVEPSEKNETKSPEQPKIDIKTETEAMQERIPGNIFSFWSISSLISFIVSAIMINNGYRKISVYSNSDFHPYDNVNAYVKGDAYNYIINSNYSTGFYVLALLFTVLGVGFLLIHFMTKKDVK